MRLRTSTTLEAFRLVLAFVLLWLADVTWDLSAWLEGLSRRVERPTRRAELGLVRLVVLSTMAGMALAVALAWSFRSEVAAAAEPPPLARHETMAEVMAVAVGSCVAAGGTWSQGIEDGVVLGRCYPLPNVGMVTVAKGSRR